MVRVFNNVRDNFHMNKTNYRWKNVLKKKFDPLIINDLINKKNLKKNCNTSTRNKYSSL